MNIFLIGFMAAGKTTLGKSLADTLDWKFIDLDEFIEGEEGQKIHEIFESKEEANFRTIEAKALRKVASSSENQVIACGGGTACFHDNMTFMNANGTTVYLPVTESEIKRRLINDGGGRPLIKNMAHDFISVLLREREVFYKRAKIILSENGGTEEWVEELRHVIP